MNNVDRIKDGFKHEILITLPTNIIMTCNNDELMESLYPTSIGFFPISEFHYVHLPKGVSDYIFILCIKGKGSITTDNKKHIVTKNQFIIIPKEKAHLYKADLVDPWSIYWFHFNGTLARTYKNLICPETKPLTLDAEKSRSLIYQFNEMIHLLKSGYSKEHLLHISNLLKTLFTNINHHSLIHNYRTSLTEDYVNKSILHMQNNLTTSLNLSELSKEVGLSKNHLMCIFKEKTASSPMEYFTQLRIQKACELLQTSHHNIKEISSMLGYDDPYYFSRVFKKVMGYSPKHYRSKSY